MAKSTCVKCGGTSFEAVEAETPPLLPKIIFIQCAGCGGVIGTTTCTNTAVTLSALEAKMDKIKNTVEGIGWKIGSSFTY